MATSTVNIMDKGCGEYRVVVTLDDFPTNTAAIAGGADKGFGASILDLSDYAPFSNAASIYVLGGGFSLSLEESDGNITADTPDVGMGTTVASGVVSVLSGTAAFENVFTGQTMNDCNGTVESNYIPLATPVSCATTDEVYLNLADGWAASGEGADGLVASGYCVIDFIVFHAF